jgi:hypothetical protein
METFRSSFERRLTASDSKHNIPFTVQVPPGTTHFRINFSFTPQVVDRIRNLLTLTVFDPSGWRGEGHRGGNRQEVTISQSQVTPGYLAGPVKAGPWKVVVNTHMVRPGPDCQIHLVVSGTDESVEETLPVWVPGRTAGRGPGWYRGDLHAHTIHSDAGWDVPDLVAYARAQRLDFATLSDHNTVSGLAQMDAARGDDLLTLGGMELTTFWGHALVLGLRDWIDWRVFPSERTMEDIEREAAHRGGLFIIAHPRSDGDPKCTGCDWRYPQMMPGTARVVEVWNNDWYSDSNDEDGLKLAYAWLNQGYRLALSAGTDNHGGHIQRRKFGFDVVYAADLTEIEILRAVRAGHLYLSAGPSLMLEAAAQGARVMMGDSLKTGANNRIQMDVHWDACPANAQMELILDGESKDCFPVQKNGTRTWEIQPDQARWGLVTIRDAQRKMLALTNPIFLDGRA